MRAYILGDFFVYSRAPSYEPSTNYCTDEIKHNIAEASVSTGDSGLMPFKQRTIDTSHHHD